MWTPEGWTPEGLWTVEAAALATILGMAVVTYALRSSGLLLSEYLPSRGPWARALKSLSGTVLLAIVAPAVVAAGWIGLPAALAAVLAMRASGNPFAAMAAGVAVIAGGRALGLG
ncbi:AzlD domain-containing protein [Arenibaculum sp.]|uniref:AzlD domain-containing protein n=1 Tax=Arenibaculum sp. TaxID=2865862 RepID=UPI002E0FC231|nr:AzlD domain-containing protein [Arenibaculum sp.]